MLAFMILGLISVGQGLPSMSTVGTVPCESPTPESIAPCTCEVDVDTNARSFHCDFNFSSNEEVTEITENIFAQFDDTNNQFNNVNFHFGGDEQSPANFAMNEKTTGKLQFKDLSIISLCVDEQSGPKLFTDNGLMNSKQTLEYFQILSHCPDSYYSFASNFLTGADKLNFVMLSGYNYDAQLFPESGGNKIYASGNTETFQSIPSHSAQHAGSSGFGDGH